MRLNHIAILFCALVAASACQTEERMTRGVKGLKGQPYQAAFDVLGFPDDESMIDGKRVFSWRTRQEGAYTIPTFNSASGVVGGQTVILQTQGSQVQYYNNFCRIDILVGDSGLIERTKYEGNVGGCEWYSQLFARQ